MLNYRNLTIASLELWHAEVYSNAFVSKYIEYFLWMDEFSLNEKCLTYGRKVYTKATPILKGLVTTGPEASAFRCDFL